MKNYTDHQNQINMKNLLILFMLFAFGCGNQTEECEKVDPDQVKQLVVDFLTATNDSNKLEALRNFTTQDYLVYLDGDVLNHDDLVDFIKAFPEPIDYQFNNFDFEIEADCNSAFVHYYARGIRAEDTTSTVFTDLHSAYIKRMDNELKLAFIHSTSAK